MIQLVWTNAGKDSIGDTDMGLSSASSVGEGYWGTGATTTVNHSVRTVLDFDDIWSDCGKVHIQLLPLSRIIKC